MTTIERFWDQVDIKSIEECWTWMGYKNKKGYGRFGITSYNKYLSHRYCWTICCGDIPLGLFVLHKCDNPSCVNPMHLFLGTNSDNMIDCSNKDRSNKPRGENNPSHKLKTIDIINIRKQYISGEYSQRQLAKMYNIHQTTIGDIVRQELWQHVSL